jgi:hypothetical protein
MRYRGNSNFYSWELLRKVQIGEVGSFLDVKAVRRMSEVLAEEAEKVRLDLEAKKA